MHEIMGAATTTYVDDLWKWNTLKKGDPNIAHLTFTKVQVWGRMVRIPKVPCTKMMMAMLALSCYKRKKVIYI